MDKYLVECKECKIDPDIRVSMCPVCLTQRIMRGKWKMYIIFLLKENTLRFSQLKKQIPKVTQAYLSSQLKELEADGIISRYSYNVVPPKVEYSLTQEGKSFITVVDSMNIWGASYIQKRMV